MPSIAADRLLTLAHAIIRAMGSSDDEAAIVARHLVEANLAGHDSHGVGMIPTYVDILGRGLLVPNASLQPVSDGGSVVVVDGGRGFGQVMAREAMVLGIERARQQGAAVVALRNSCHVGRVGTYGEQTVEAGLASVHFVNVADHQPWQAPFACGDARLGTNPFCAACPAKDGAPLVLDMATSAIAFGKARVARNKGVPVPDGCLIDAQGGPINDPAPIVDRHEGALLAFGDHKGSGLAVMCEILGAALIGGQTIAAPWNQGIVNNMLSIVIDPERFGAREAIRAEIERVIGWIKQSPPAQGHERVLLPGDPERLTREERQRGGVPVDDNTFEGLMSAAASLGLDRTQLTAAAGVEP